MQLKHEKGLSNILDSFRQQEMEKEQDMTYDHLTNVYTRQYLSVLETELQLEDYWIVTFKVKYFWKINSIFGFQVGDVLLQKFVERLKEQFTNEVPIVRLTGCEFVLFYQHNGASIKEFQNYFKYIFTELNKDYYIEKKDVSISCLMGVFHSIENVTSLAKMLEFYRLKMKKTNSLLQIHSVSDELYPITDIDLYQAMKHNQLFFHFHPQVNVETNELFGFELLLRWKHPQFGLIPVDKFIALAEQSDMIIELGKWIIDRAFQTIKEWEQRNLPYGKVSINLSPLQLYDGKFLSFLKTMITQYEITPQQITFEITESASIIAQMKFIHILSHIRELGFQLAIDDFGKGYSALSYIDKLPVDYLKIDKIFTDKVVKNDLVIKMIQSLANSLKLEVIVEGVEEEDQKEKLEKIGCKIIQGFYIAKPFSKDKAESFMMKALKI